MNDGLDIQVDVVRPDLAAIAARAKDATPGPWHVDESNGLQVWTSGDSVLGGTIHEPGDEPGMVQLAKALRDILIDSANRVLPRNRA